MQRNNTFTKNKTYTRVNSMEPFTQGVLFNTEKAEKYFRNLIKSNRDQIAYTIFRLIWNQTDVRLVPNRSENGKYNLILV